MDYNLYDITRQLLDFQDSPCNPHSCAIVTVLSLLNSVSPCLPQGLPRAIVTSDVAGSAYIIWRNGQRNLSLIVPADEAKPVVLSHNNYAQDRAYNTEINPAVQCMTEWLIWYTTTCIPFASTVHSDDETERMHDDMMLTFLVLGVK